LHNLIKVTQKAAYLFDSCNNISNGSGRTKRKNEMTKKQAMEYAQDRANRYGQPVYVWFYGYRWWTADETYEETAIAVRPDGVFTNA
jgi:murein DD-endopeptidase MepM/ murein hydrolase activator NlpD